MQKKIKVLQVLNSLGIGGNVVFVMNYIRAIDKSKFQIDFLLFDSKHMNYAEEVRDMGCNIHICDIHSKNNNIRRIKQMKYVYELLKTESYDVIHAHSCSFEGIFRAVIPARIYNNSLIIGHSHNPGLPKNTIFDNFIRWIMKKFMCFCIDYGFACSDDAGASKYTKKFMHSNQYKTIRNAVDTKKYRFNLKKRKEIREQYHMEHCYVIGSVGRLEEQKNYSYLIDVFFDVLQQNPMARLLLIGQGSHMNMLKEKVDKYQMNKQVVFIGESATPEIYYSAMDLFVLTSIYEGFGLVNVEAQAAGLPCIISDVAPKLVDCTGNCTFLSLKEGRKVWAKKILSTKPNDSRENVYLQCNKYDIFCAVKELEEYYKRGIHK